MMGNAICVNHLNLTLIKLKCLSHVTFRIGVISAVLFVLFLQCLCVSVFMLYFHNQTHHKLEKAPASKLHTDSNMEISTEISVERRKKTSGSRKCSFGLPEGRNPDWIHLTNTFTVQIKWYLMVTHTHTSLIFLFQSFIKIHEIGLYRCCFFKSYQFFLYEHNDV